ncbi:MAG: LacI family DNA-binding transcriptional regulator [Terriglobia bacterium]
MAKLAGVSIPTVYRVASGNAGVSREIQKRVRDAAEKIGIGLDRKKKPNVLAFLLSNREMLHPFHSHILMGAEAACTARGWDMVFQLFRYDTGVPWKNLHLPRILQRRVMARAAVLAGTNSLNLLELLKHREIPFAVLGNNVLGDGSHLPFDAVYSDDMRGAYEMTRYLQELHHQDIWFVGNNAEPWCVRCLAGYERAMKEMDLPARASTLESDNATEVGYLATKSLLARDEPVTAILGSTDETAEGIYKALKERGLAIPGDVSVAGCNDTFGARLAPPLTTIREFPEQLGRRMVELLLNRIEQPGLAPQQVTIPTELVKRESCGICAASGVTQNRQNIASTLSPQPTGVAGPG